MKAVMCKEFGPLDSLAVEEVEAPRAGPGEVVIEVRAAAVNYPDFLLVQNKYQFKPPLPFSPGAEAAGVVVEVGEGVTDRKIGDRVLAVKGWGCFAERVAVDARAAIPFPDEMDFPTASALVMAYGTSHYALKLRAGLQPGESLLVLGAAGGVGLAAVDLGKAMGARVIAAASSAAKLATCREYGADEVIDYSKEDLKQRTKELTGGAGADVVYDPVGGEYAEAALRATAWAGRYLVIGFTAGIPKIPLNLTLLKGCDVRGVFWGAYTARDPQGNLANVRELMAWYREGKIRPRVTATYGFDEVPRALAEVAERRVQGKIVILPPGASA